MTEELKLCKDCKWCKPAKFLWFTDMENARCLNYRANEVIARISYVDGSIITPDFKPEKCNTLRHSSRICCTTEAKFFEPKQC